MQVGVIIDSLAPLPLAEALQRAASWSITDVEMGTGNFSRAPYCQPATLLTDAGARRELLRTVERSGLRLTALNCSGNQLHPVTGAAADQVIRNTIRLAAELGVETVVTMSGLPGGTPEDRSPNWIINDWPPEFPAMLRWQWQERIIPYWTDLVAFAEQHGVRKLALEMHPNQAVYNVRTLLKLREEVGPIVGANLDPSHLWWQGMDPCDVAAALSGAIYHAHGKDTRIDPANSRVHGNLDMVMGEEAPASAWPWRFRSVGLGHDQMFWNEFIWALKAAGFDGTVAIEPGDPHLKAEQGIPFAARTLREAMGVIG